MVLLKIVTIIFRLVGGDNSQEILCLAVEKGRSRFLLNKAKK